MIKGIDVSSHQGKINWQAVKDSGIKFAMIRAGWSWYEGGMNIDKTFYDNMQGAQAAGLDVGVYLYSYDKTPAAARIATKRLLEIIAPYKLTYPIAFDIEDAIHTQISKAQNTAICKAFMDEVEVAGYYGTLYTYTNFINSYLNKQELTKYDKWIADYRAKCGYDGPYGMWQYTGSGSCPGVTGNCDLNECYKDYPAIIKKAGLNGWGKVPEPPQQTQKTFSLDLPKLQEQGYSTVEIKL